MRINRSKSLLESLNENLKESTTDKEWESVCKEFCKQIGAELLFVNDDNFGYEDKDGKLVHMYADELEKYLKDRKKSNKANLKEVYKSSRKKLTETTNKGIESKKKDLYDRIRQALKDAGDKDWENIVGYTKRLPKDLVDKFDIEEDEIRCIDMIHSILTYSNDRDIENLIKDKYLQQYISSLGEDKVRQLLTDEIEEFKNATINKDVYTDSEGLTYNSVTFKDDLNEEDALSYGYDINTFIDNYEYPPEIEPEEAFRNSGDSSYFTVVKNEREAERFNYHSDYWGSEEEYQNQNVELVSELESFIEDGSKMYFKDDDGTKHEFIITGVAIDRQYNSISHTKILIKELEDTKEVNESIEQKYEKSNEDYNSRLKDVKQYTGSYTYLFGGKVENEWNGYPIKVNYFYYERPYDKTSYNLVVNVLTPYGVSGEYIQDAIDSEFDGLKYERLSNKQVKEKINQIISSLD